MVLEKEKEHNMAKKLMEVCLDKAFLSGWAFGFLSASVKVWAIVNQKKPQG